MSSMSGTYFSGTPFSRQRLIVLWLPMAQPRAFSFRIKEVLPPAISTARSSASCSGVVSEASIPSIVDRFFIYASISILQALYPARMSIHKLIREGRQRLKMTEQEFADAVGVTRGSVQHWEREGGTAPRRALQPVVARVLGLTVAELMAGGESNVGELEIGRKVPLISWVEAGLLNDISDPYSPGDAEEWVSTTESSPSSEAFALRVSGSSMTSPDPDAQYSFPEGTILIVDPNREAMPGDFVIAKDVDTQQATFKRLATDGGRWYLKPLNPQFKTVEIDDPSLRVIGRVVEFHRHGKL
jgi:SOS-response transcriptional repressor LexA